MADNVARQKQFKNAGRHEEMRRRRAEGSLELRKQRKDEMMMKRRNVDVHELSGDEENKSPVDGTSTRVESTLRLLTLLDCFNYLKEGGDYSRRYQAVESIRRHLSRQKNPPIDEVIKMGLVPFLVKALFNSQEPKIQFEAAWALTNITSGNSDQTMVVVTEGAIPPLVNLLSSPDNQVAEQSAWALANITGESAQFRDIVIEGGLLDPLLALATRPDLTIDCLRTLAWTMSNLCRYKNPQIVAFSVVEKLTPLLAVMIFHQDSSVVCDVCWALAYISDGAEDRIDVILKSGIMNRLAELASSNEQSVVAPALRCLGNIVTGNDQQTQAVLDLGVLKTVVPAALSSNTSTLTRESCWLISNICAGTPIQIQAVLDTELLTDVSYLLEKGDFRTQTEAAWTIFNIASGGTNEQACVLFRYGVLPKICNLLKAKDPRVVMLALDVLGLLLSLAEKMGHLDQASVIVEECNGLDQIEQLQNHENDDVYQKALQLVEKFFSVTDVETNVTTNGELQFQNPGDAPADGYNF